MNVKKMLYGSFVLILFVSANAFSHCPLSPHARAIIEESAERNTLEARWILEQTHEGSTDRGFARNLIASVRSHLGVYTMIGICTGPQSFDPFCETACGAEAPCTRLERCSQLSCDAAKIDSVKLWWRPAPIKYVTDQENLPRYSINYLNQPTTNIRFDNTKVGEMNISWTAKDRVLAKPSGRRTINARSFLKGRGLTTQDGPQRGEVEVIYPHLARNKKTTAITLNLNEHGSLNGLVLVNKVVVGKIVEGLGKNQASEIQWVPTCSKTR